MPWLLVNPGAPEARTIELKPGRSTLGRSGVNDFPLDDPSISSRHCEFLVEEGRVIIRDLGSTNGTFVNYAPASEAVLLPGQTIHFGNVEARVCSEAPPLARPELPVAPPGSATLGAIPTAAKEAIPLRAVRVGESTTLVLDIPSPLPAAAPVAAPTPATTAGKGYFHATTQFCKFHPKTPARFHCKACNRFYCELCVNTHGRQEFCRACGSECVPVEVRYQRPPPPKGFYARLPGVFLYPLRGWGVLMLIVGTILLAVIKFGGGMGGAGMRGGMGTGFRGGLSFGWWGLMARVVVLGYLFTYMQSIIHSTAIAEEEMPAMPDLTNFWEDILLPCLQLIGLTLISFAPAIAVAAWVVVTERESTGPLLMSAFALGCLYFPMAFLAVALLDSVAAANPLQVIPSIFKVPLEYLVALVALAGVLGIRALGDFMLGLIFPKGLSTRSIGELLGMFAAQAFWSLVSLYLLVVGMRILGLLYLTKKDQLGWYSQPS
jgi:hypothetical protein